MSTIYDVKTRTWTTVSVTAAPTYRIPKEPKLPSPRVTYYTVDVDPRIQPRKKTEYSKPSPLVQGTEDNPANLISSLCEDGKHRLILDCDVTDISLKHLKSYYLDVFRYRDAGRKGTSSKAEKALKNSTIIRSGSHLHVYTQIEFTSWSMMVGCMPTSARLRITEEWIHMVRKQKQALLRLPVAN